MKVLVTGHAGYVGSKLVPALLAKGHDVVGVDVVQTHAPNGWDQFTPAGAASYISHRTDIRHTARIKELMTSCDAVIHLACLSNDPTCDLDPALTKSINLDSFRPLVKAAKDAGVKRFIFASSSSVYGVKKEINVTEDLPLEPLTDYSTYKALCEDILLEERQPGFETVIVRPATVCGYAPSMRLDLLVHILTMSALRTGTINVHGGHQYRPNIHIDDMVDVYLRLLEAPAARVDGQIFNAGTQNLTILETAELVKSLLGDHIQINVTESTDPRSYHVNSDKIQKEIWQPSFSVEDAIQSVVIAWKNGDIPSPDDDRYYRIRSVKQLGLVA
jgi:nucleoside-diphosphate-sugar epimerase